MKPGLGWQESKVGVKEESQVGSWYSFRLESS
jgi:hypothetical protein